MKIQNFFLENAFRFIYPDYFELVYINYIHTFITLNEKLYKR